MEAEEEDPASQLISLLDFNWFNRLILSNSVPPRPVEEVSSPPIVPRLQLRLPNKPNLHRRSFSDENIPPPLESSIVRLPKLETIMSGKEGEVRGPINSRSLDSETKKAGRRRRRWRRMPRSESRSMTDLEFEELKGFMDLGFNFSDVEDPRLISIVPGLQRLRAGGAEEVEGSPSATSDAGSDEAVVTRPYLSEAWEVAEAAARMEVKMLKNFRIPATGEGIDLKDHLRVWAQAVASTVR